MMEKYFKTFKIIGWYLTHIIYILHHFIITLCTSLNRTGLSSPVRLMESFDRTYVVICRYLIYQRWGRVRDRSWHVLFFLFILLPILIIILDLTFFSFVSWPFFLFLIVFFILFYPFFIFILLLEENLWDIIYRFL